MLDATETGKYSVKEVKFKPKTNEIEIKLYDRAAALNALAKAEGMFIERAERRRRQSILIRGQRVGRKAWEWGFEWSHT